MQFDLPDKISATYKMTTPMFLGGSDKMADSKIFRVSSFKGVLRFWWRALNWGRCYQSANGHELNALALLHKEESCLFGAATNDGKGSQGLFNLNISGEFKIEKGHELLPEEKGYLLGMGLYHYKTKIARSRIMPGATIEVHLIIKSKATEEQKRQLSNALQALGYFGGLGSRSRRGYGSLAIQSIKADSIHLNIETISLEDLRKFKDQLDISAPKNAPLSAITAGTRIDLSLQGKNCGVLMGILSDSMQLYRSYGNKDKLNRYKVNGKDALQLFAEDHDNVFRVIKGLKLEQLPKRAIFGLPHNYRYSTGEQVDITAKGPKMERRASPLFIHMHQFPDGQFVAIQTFLPARFLPQDVPVEIKYNRKPSHLKTPTVDEKVIHGYLDFENFTQKEVLLRG